MPAAIEIREVHKRFGELRALSGIDLEVPQGEFFGLLGPNGAGKTTLISVLAGLVRADLGSARIMGHDVRTDYRAARRSLGVVPQELVFDPFFTVRETLFLQSGYFGMRENRAWIDEVMHNLDLASKADVNMRALSGGMKRRVLVAQALVHKPPVIVLDEPTAGVDVELRQGLWQFVRRLNRDGHSIVLTTHYLEEAEAHCQRIAMLKDGRIVALDTTRNLLGSFSGLELRVHLERDSLPAGVPGRVLDADGGQFRLRLANPLELEAALARLREAGATIREMEVHPPDLEEVFLRLTGRAS
ncbi:MAG TPA: ABC transporter ATP-binding protein [Burkholderiales bacterium]|nr:ABC transporter ATP-binding protein [Burkholderiales bacterium]